MKLACYLLFFIAFFTNSYEISGKVIKVTDGDTVTIITSDYQKHRIRLYCIDTPEKGEPNAQKAKQTLADMIFKKKVKASCIGKDRYKRDICTIRYRGRNINLQMVKRGLAKVFRKYCDDNMYYRAE